MTDIKSQEEKIDYLYTQAKRNEKRENIRFFLTWIYRLTILGYISYFFMITIPNIIDKIPSFSGTGEGMNIGEILENPKIKGLYESYFQK